MPDDFENLDEYAKTRSSAYGVPFESIVREFITARQKEKLRRMIGFRFTKDKNYNLPAKRLKAIEAHLQKRTDDLLKIPNKALSGRPRTIKTGTENSMNGEKSGNADQTF